jgi:dTDP-4-amino-4,6-dideoxygalactose transaminase
MLTKYRTNYSLPIVEKVYEEILTLPCQLNLTIEEQDYVIKTIKDFFHE